MKDLNEELQETKVQPIKKKDFWDKLQILAGILLPLAIVYVGHAFSAAQSAAEIRSNHAIATMQENMADKQLEFQKEISATNSKVGQVGLVSNFFDALLSDEPVRKKLAIKAVLIALKEEGPDLVKIVEESEDEGEIKSYAAATLDLKRKELVASLFSSSASERIKAANDIVTGWKNDSQIVNEVLDFAIANHTNGNGIVNSLVVLAGMNESALIPYRSRIEEFITAAESKGPTSLKWANEVRSRLPEARQ